VCTSLRMATRSVNRLYDRALSPVGLRVTGYSIMSRLAEEGPLSVSELAGRVEQVQGVRLAELLAGLPGPAADGEAALAAVLRLARDLPVTPASPASGVLDQ
jgi:NIL domain